MTEIKLGLTDSTGREIKIGDKISFFYINPVGELTDKLEDEVFKIIFKLGSAGFLNKYGEFLPLIGYVERKCGDYIGNHGNLEIITGKCPTIKIVG